MWRVDDDQPIAERVRIGIVDRHIEIGNVVDLVGDVDIRGQRLRRRVSFNARNHDQPCCVAGRRSAGSRSFVHCGLVAEHGHRTRHRAKEAPFVVEPGDQLTRLRTLPHHARLQREAREIAVADLIKDDTAAPGAGIGQVETGRQQIDVDRPLLACRRQRKRQRALWRHRQFRTGPDGDVGCDLLLGQGNRDREFLARDDLIRRIEGRVTDHLDSGRLFGRCGRRRWRLRLWFDGFIQGRSGLLRVGLLGAGTRQFLLASEFLFVAPLRLLLGAQPLLVLDSGGRVVEIGVVGARRRHVGHCLPLPKVAAAGTTVPAAGSIERNLVLVGLAEVRTAASPGSGVEWGPGRGRPSSNLTTRARLLRSWRRIGAARRGFIRGRFGSDCRRGRHKIRDARRRQDDLRHLAELRVQDDVGEHFGQDRRDRSSRLGQPPHKRVGEDRVGVRLVSRCIDRPR